MAGKNAEAATAGDRHGSKGLEAGESYCPPARRRRQRDRLLEHLRERGNISTVEARDWLRMMSPASRIMELRRDGWTIVRRFDKHQGCGRYHLLDQGGGDDG